MAKWKCEICGNEFDNFHAQGFDNRIDGPLCYFKKENQKLKKQYCERTDCSGRIGNSKKVEELQQENKKQKELIDKAVLELANIDGNLSNSQLSDRICNLIDILKG